MPAPAVYVLAIVGTVGAVLAFKEFVYEPHIAPTIDRWMIEFQAARRRRTEAAMNRSEGDLLMSQTENRNASSRIFSGDEDGSDDETPSGAHGKGSNASNNKYMRNGLLLRRPERDTQHMQNQQDVELENLVSSEVSQRRKEVTSQFLRQRKKNVSEDAMDESIQAIPYSPLSPSRTHVLFDTSSPSTPSSGSRPTSPPPPPQSPLVILPRPVSFSMTSGATSAGDSASPSPAPHESKDQIQNLASPSPPSPAFSPQLNTSPPSQVSPFQQMITQSTLFGSGPETTPTVNIPSTATDSTSPPNLLHHPLQQSYTQSIPSLSQSYPQDLDYEHGLELLSPPSSRSISPFSIASMSPNPGAPNVQGLRTLSPFSSVSRSASNFSSAVSSPSPFGMGLGNESFDTVSPIVQPRQLGQSVSPFLDPPSLSVTNSARSTTYLSFADDSSDDGDIDRASQAQPYANLGASTGLEGTFGTVSPQPVPLYSSTHSLASGSNSLLFLNSSHPDRAMPTGQTPTQGSFLVSQSRPRPADGLGLSLFPVPPREPRTPPTSIAHVNPFPEPSAHAVPSYFRTSPVNSHAAAAGYLRAHAPAQSDGELSDLDLMSDYATSESDLGNESDSSWSMAGGSNAGGSNAASPRLGAEANPNVAAAATLSRGDTIRGTRGNRFGSR